MNIERGFRDIASQLDHRLDTLKEDLGIKDWRFKTGSDVFPSQACLGTRVFTGRERSPGLGLFLEPDRLDADGERIPGSADVLTLAVRLPGAVAGAEDLLAVAFPEDSAQELEMPS